VKSSVYLGAETPICTDSEQIPSRAKTYDVFLKIILLHVLQKKVSVQFMLVVY